MEAGGAEQVKKEDPFLLKKQQTTPLSTNCTTALLLQIQSQICSKFRLPLHLLIMDKFVIRSKKPTIVNIEPSNTSHGLPDVDNDANVGRSSPKRARTCESDMVSDPGLRKPIDDYDPRIRDDVRREYVTKGPCQPLSHDFVKRGQGRRFGDGVFVTTGFRNWKKACENFKEHVGTHGSVHNGARALFFAFKDQMQSLTRKVLVGKKILGEAYRVHDETKSSLNRGNFLELLDLIREQNPKVQKVAMENAPRNHQLTCHDIQMQLLNACASKTRKAIIDDIGDKFFSLLIDEARDNSIKE
ncbi:hypothetical protein V2J09_020781 [Rumex salicifolius]